MVDIPTVFSVLYSFNKLLLGFHKFMGVKRWSLTKQTESLASLNNLPHDGRECKQVSKQIIKKISWYDRLCEGNKLGTLTEWPSGEHPR